jgi:hypothetical protein
MYSYDLKNVGAARAVRFHVMKSCRFHIFCCERVFRERRSMQYAQLLVSKRHAPVLQSQHAHVALEDLAAL